MAAATGTTFREDIQGLRALAVSLVLIYHVWPGLVPGGYVGVDVFFVISGFLITSHLIEHPPRSGLDLAAFWGRRIRRILPAAFLVLIVTAVASRLLAPSTQWGAIATEIIASGLYVENWVLALTATDYLAAEAAPTPLQHFWSLAIEEQFYLFWPVLILVAAGLAARLHAGFMGLGRIAMLLVVGSSLAASVWITPQEPTSAYFITPTRVWELAVGGFVSTLAPLGATRIGRAISTPVAWLGVVGIVIAGALFSDTTPFPGTAALLPVLATALVIHATATSRLSPTTIFAIRPIQHLGDISYSVYLWHWPIIVLLPNVSGTLGLLDSVAIVLATLVLATLSKHWVEDGFRFAPRMQALRATYRFAAAGMLGVVAIAGVQLLEVQLRATIAAQGMAAAGRPTDDVAGIDDGSELLIGAPGPASCFGAASIVRGFDVCPQDPAAAMVPPPELARDDRSDAYRDHCWASGTFAQRRTCTYGDGPVRVALVGNSHGGQWLPALQALAEPNSWTVTTFLANRCNVTDTPLAFDTPDKTAGCLEHGRWVMEQTAGDAFHLVVIAERQSLPAAGETMETTLEPAHAGYRSYLERWAEAGTNVLNLRDTPFPRATLQSIPDCLARNPSDHDACSGSFAEWRWIDPLYEAAQELQAPGVSTFDPNGYLCVDGRCPAVIGTVIVYFDASHMTATYVRTLAPYVKEPIGEALARSANAQ